MPLSIPPFRSERWKICQPRINLSRVGRKILGSFWRESNSEEYCWLVEESGETLAERLQNIFAGFAEHSTCLEENTRRKLVECWQKRRNQKILRKKINSTRVSMEFKRIIDVQGSVYTDLFNLCVQESREYRSRITRD